jgi:DNA polymerase sigma
MSIWRVPNYDVLEKCTEDILSLIKPVEGDRNKRIYAIQELADTIYSAGALRGASVKPFGSFVSQLYAKSGDLDVSVELFNALNLPISKRKKQDTLREVRRALQKRGIARHMEFIPNARVPVLQYVSNQYGISCDISISNYPGRIKSKIFYWINTLDDRFGDMVLLVKEWAKAQNINDPKNGTLNSYSLCLLVLFHFQVLFLTLQVTSISYLLFH